MGILEITIDSWTVGNQTMICTIVIQSICLFITLLLFITRIYHIYHIPHQLKSSWKFALLHFSQLIMLFFSLIYLFLYEWNYIHIFIPSNPIDCNIWLRSLAFSFSITRISLFLFLMLRSSISFEGTICAISSKLTIPIIISSIAPGVLLTTAIVTEFDAFPLKQNTGICWRTATETGKSMKDVAHGLNMLLSVVVLVIFCWKVRYVKKETAILEKNNALNMYSLELQSEFNKHIKLGILTVSGTVFLFFFGDLLTVLLGISFALDQTVNNVLTFIMFKEHTNAYECLCCVSRPHHVDSVSNIISFEGLKQKDTSSRTTTTATQTFVSTTTSSTTKIESTQSDEEPITEVTRFTI